MPTTPAPHAAAVREESGVPLSALLSANRAAREVSTPPPSAPDRGECPRSRREQARAAVR